MDNGEDTSGETGGIQSDFSLSSCLLLNVAKLVGKEWKDLGRVLNLQEWELESIYDQYRNIGLHEVAFQTLMTWKKKDENAKMDSLKTHLKSIDRNDIINYAFPSHTVQTVSEGRTDEVEKCLNNLKTRLTREYQALRMSGLPWMTDIELTLEEYYAGLTLRKSDKRGMQTEEPIKLRELFHSYDSKKASVRILAEGGPGLGKSTLAAKLAFDWATRKEYVGHFDLAFLVPLRFFARNLHETLVEASLLGSTEDDDFEQILQSKSILLLLDGYDEASEDTKETVQALLRNDSYSRMTVIVFSRPVKMFSQTENKRFSTGAGSRPPKHIYWDKRLTVDGLNTQQQKLFVDKHVAGLSEDQKSTVRFKLDKMVDKKFLSCPLFLLMLTVVFTSDEDMERAETKTDLYKHVFNFVIRRYFSKTEPEICVSEIDLFSFVEGNGTKRGELMVQFSRFALWAIKANLLSFSRKDIMDTCHCDPKILDLGFLKTCISVKGMRKNVVYEAVHKSLLEFAAAYGLWLAAVSDSKSDWRNEVKALRPQQGPSFSSLCFPFLMGLMGDKANDLLTLLTPFAAEYSSQFDCLWTSLQEVDTTFSLLYSMEPLLPLQWNIPGSVEKSDFPTSVQHEEIVRWVIEKRIIQDIRWDVSYPARLPKDVRLNTLILDVNENWQNKNKGESPYYFSNYIGSLHCNDLWCNMARYVTETFLCYLQVMNFQRVSFNFDNEFLTEINETLSHGDFQTVPIYHLKLQPYSKSLEALETASQLMKRERIEVLDIDLGALENEALLDEVITFAAQSTNLASFILRSKSIQLQYKPIWFNLAKLCCKRQTSWEWIQVKEGIMLDCSEVFNTDTVIRHLDVASCDIAPKGKLTFLQCFHLNSLACPASLLAGTGNDWPISQLLTELNVVVDESLIKCGISSLSIKLQNLQILALSMSPFDYHRLHISVHHCLLNCRSFIHLKGLEIWAIENNPMLTKDLLKTVITQNAPGGASVATLPLQYVMLNCRSMYVLDAESIDCLKKGLSGGSFQRLDIVPRVSERFQPICPRDILQCFTPEEGYVVVHDLWGSRADDSIYSKGTNDLIPRGLERWSYTYQRKR